MAAAYFDTTDSESTDLLYSGARTHAEIINVVDAVEDEVIESFRVEGSSPHQVNTATTPEGVYNYTENGVEHTVYLWGFRPLAAEAAGYDSNTSNWSGFCAAMRLAIANVVSVRLRNYDNIGGLIREQAGREMWEYQRSRELLWPKGWDKPLKKYVPAGSDPRIAWGT